MHNKKTDTESYIISVSVLLLLFIFKSDNEDFEKYNEEQERLEKKTAIPHKVSVPEE